MGFLGNDPLACTGKDLLASQCSRAHTCLFFLSICALGTNSNCEIYLDQEQNKPASLLAVPNKPISLKYYEVNMYLKGSGEPS